MSERLGVKEIVDAISSLTVLELAELIDILKEKFGIQGQVPLAFAAAPVGVATAPQAQEAVVEEKTAFDVIIESVPEDAKIKVIKEVRAITGLGLKEAKTFVEEVPKAIKEGVSKEEAEKIKAQLEAAGAKVVIK